MKDQAECAELADLLAEVATGAASGPDRERLLRHLNECDACRSELDELSRQADEVLLIAPEREPPAAFEGAVLDQIAASLAAQEWQPRWFARPAVYAAAAVVFGIGGAGTVWQATSDERELAATYSETLDVADGRYFTAEPLVDAAGAEVGHVFLYEGNPSWVFAVLGPWPDPGTYEVVVRTTDGQEQTIAACEVESAGCSGGGIVDASIWAIQDIRLIAPDGTTYTTAPEPRRS